jgi:cell division protein FtsB
MFKNKFTINYRVITVNTVMVMLIAYFVFHSLSGERGILAYFRLKKIAQEQNVVLESLVEERIKLESMVKYLHPNSLNTDFLDELARRDLGLVGEDEKIIYLTNSNN